MNLRGAAAVLALGSACATVSPERGNDEVAANVEARTGLRTGWEQGTPADEAIAARVDELLRGGLTRARAIEIALVNSPALQVTYEELGIAQADLVQAGLLQNPSLGLDFGFILSGVGVNELTANLVQTFLDSLLLPLRRELAAARFAAEVRRVSQAALDTAAEVSAALAAVQARVRLLALQRDVVETYWAASELAARQREAGNVTALFVLEERGAYEQARLELAADELALVEDRERLNRLLGLWGPRTEWTLAGELPPLPAGEPDLEGLEALAIRERLDLAAARGEVALFEKAFDVASVTRAFGPVEVGAEYHRDPDGPQLLGPTLRLELPIFDQRQAVIARVQAQARQARRRVEALAVETRSEVRLARTRLLAARRVVEHYRDVLGPVRRAEVEQTRLQYNAMQVGLYALVAARREEVEARRGELVALREYWEARAGLERAVGGRLPPADAPPAPGKPTP